MVAKSPLPPQWDLPLEIRARFGDRAGRQRAMFENDHLLLVLHAPPQPDANERVARFFWRKPEGAWHGSESSGGASTLTRHLDEYAQLLEKIDRSLDNATLARHYFAVLSHLSPLVRSARNLHKTLQTARDHIDTQEIISARDRAYELERTAELLYEDAKNGLEFATARRAEEQALASHRMEVAAHRLNMLAAFFFPMATLSAVFGVNMIHGFETFSPPYAFLIFVGVAILLGLILSLFVSFNLPADAKPEKPDPYQKRI